MATGTVKWFNKDKGFGFIQPDEGGRDIYVHISNIETQDLSDGQRVEYEMAMGRKGPEATQVKAIL
jgi:CspA family cold shock protein